MFLIESAGKLFWGKVFVVSEPLQVQDIGAITPFLITRMITEVCKEGEYLFKYPGNTHRKYLISMPGRTTQPGCYRVVYRTFLRRQPSPFPGRVDFDKEDTLGCLG